MIKTLFLKRLGLKRLGLMGLAGAALSLAMPAMADDNIEFPATRPNFPFRRSTLTDQLVVIPPYRHAFRVRIFTTPQQDPYYNVPPYSVVTPY